MKPWSEKLTLPRPLRDVRLRQSKEDAARPASEEELRDSYERGRHDGERKLSEQLMQQRNETHQLMTGILESLRNSPAQIMHDTENTLIALALSVAHKLVAGFPISVAMIEAAVRDALSQIEGTAQFTIRLHPDDFELLQKAESPLLTEHAGRDFQFLTSPEVTRGGCMVLTQFGMVDARRETKFELLQRSLAS